MLVRGRAFTVYGDFSGAKGYRDACVLAHLASMNVQLFLEHEAFADNDSFLDDGNDDDIAALSDWGDGIYRHIHRHMTDFDCFARERFGNRFIMLGDESLDSDYAALDDLLVDARTLFDHWNSLLFHSTHP